ncbi:MAG TPA: 16S rRNA (cytosine(967)-C(5))-methyltransferase RsmB [Burkholderiaceae bacterium]|nr:16S rRNA (cytosine(967)-C(5))-methyltransferase RsmB [Burkholderiaceae bacterium]
MSTGASPALADVLRSAAVAWQSFRSGRSLDRALATAVADHPEQRPAVQDTLYNAIRHLALSERIVERLAARAPTPNVAAILAVSLAQLQRDSHAPHTIVDQAVRAQQLQPGPANLAQSGFVNAVLRNFLRRREALLAELRVDETVRYNLPAWWIERLRREYPNRWTSIAESQQQMPPLILRINSMRTTVGETIERLAERDIAASQVGAHAVWMHQPQPVSDIPGFAEGDVSVQDAGAQLAAPWLAATPAMRLLDACAAPGGKTAHLAELGATDLTAVESDCARAARINANLDRCHLAAHVVIGDAAHPDTWIKACAPPSFDRILLDAPCTASGIVRRHPDIPWLRRPADVAQLTTLQAELLDALWPLLRAGGRLLYVVCSLFPEEGREQIARFGERHPDARRCELPASQLLPASAASPSAVPTWQGSSLPTLHDGFFYALLEKSG